MASGEATVKKALDQLKSTLSTEHADMFSNTSLGDIWSEARNIEGEQGARLDLKYMRRLEPLLHFLESYASIIEVFCQGYAPMAFVWVKSIVPHKSLVLLIDESLRVQSS